MTTCREHLQSHVRTVSRLRENMPTSERPHKGNRTCNLLRLRSHRTQSNGSEPHAKFNYFNFPLTLNAIWTCTVCCSPDTSLMCSYILLLVRQLLSEQLAASLLALTKRTVIGCRLQWSFKTHQKGRPSAVMDELALRVEIRLRRSQQVSSQQEIHQDLRQHHQHH